MTGVYAHVVIGGSSGQITVRLEGGAGPAGRVVANALAIATGVVDPDTGLLPPVAYQPGQRVLLVFPDLPGATPCVVGFVQ